VGVYMIDLEESNILWMDMHHEYGGDKKAATSS
jgi:hypothetical protein